VNTRTVAQFKQWAIAHTRLARAVCAAKALAQLERERVNAYVLPIFKTYRFLDESGAPIDSPDALFLCKDDAMCKAFYDACDVAHRAHGWRGREGHCPALTAEHLLITAENALLEAGCEFLGPEQMPSALYGGDKRKEMLDLLLGACLRDPRGK
jgi:hypothetical protein